MAKFDEAMAPHLDRLSVGPVNEHHLVSLVTALRGALASALAFLSGDAPAPTDRQATIEAAASEPEGVSLASDAAPEDPPADPPAPVVTAEPLVADVEPAQS